MKANPAEPFPIIENVKEVLKEATLFGAVALVRASPPCRVKGLGKPFDAALEKNMPHPSP